MNKVYLLFIYMLTNDRGEWGMIFCPSYSEVSPIPLYMKMVKNLRTAGQQILR